MPSSNDNSDPENGHQQNTNDDQSNNGHHQDASGNVTIFYDISRNSSYVSHIQDISTNNVFSAVCDDDTVIPIPIPIVLDLSSSVLHGPGYDITNQTGKSADGAVIIREIFTSSTDPSNNDVNINENLTEIVVTYTDASNNNQADVLLNQIKLYASEINCSDFHGKGTIDDYAGMVLILIGMFFSEMRIFG